MIVVDTNVIAYLVIPSNFTKNCENLWAKNSDWHAPTLWRSEVANVIANNVRHYDWKIDKALKTFGDAENVIVRSHATNFAKVVELIYSSKLTAYDCEFVALAQELGCKLVTLDKKILTEFPNLAVSLLDF